MTEAVAVEPPVTLITGDELYTMVGVESCELIDGRIVPMSPTGFEHGEIEGSLTAALRAYVRQNRLGYVATGEVGIYIQRDPDRIRAADVLVIAKNKLPDGKPRTYLTVAPDLIVEIISPSDSWADLRIKLRDYFAIAVPMVLVVEPATRTVLVYRSITSVQELGRGDTLHGEGVLDGFSIAVDAIFDQE